MKTLLALLCLAALTARAQLSTFPVSGGGGGATTVAGITDAGTAAYSNATAFALSPVPFTTLQQTVLGVLTNNVGVSNAPPGGGIGVQIGTNGNMSASGTVSAAAVTATGVSTFQTVDANTNTWTINTDFGLGTNSFVTAASVTGGFTGVANKSTSTERFGQLTIISTGTLVFTNPVSVHTSDFLSSRTITNGNTCVIAVDLMPGQCTNMAIVQFK